MNRGWFSKFLARAIVVAGLGLAAGGAATAPAYAAASGEITVAVSAEPETLLPRDACSYAANFVMDNVYEKLTRRQNGVIGGWLAESYSQVDDTTWRFKLHQGIKFSDGEPLNAAAVVATVNYFLDPGKASRCRGDFATVAGAQAVDDYTFDLKATKLDPTIPSILLKLPILAPKWLASTPDQQAAVSAVGTGAYTLGEWVKGDHVTLKANDDYWGLPKPSIATVKLVARGEAAVRTAMVAAGEADAALNISKDQADSLPKEVVEPTTESVFIRLNTQNPLLADVRVRKAIALSIDTGKIIQALFPGVSSPLSGHVLRKSAVGFDPSLKDYPVDPDQAASLVQQAGASGKSLDLIVRTDLMSNVDELGEALQAMIEATGLTVNIVPMEAAPWRDLLFANKAGQKRADMMIISASNAVFDSSRITNYYFGTGPSSEADSPELQTKIDAAAPLTGNARVAAYQAIWREIHDNYWAIPLFGNDFIHGLSKRLDWTPRDDGYTYFNTFKLIP